MISHSEIEYQICDTCKRFTMFYHGVCLEHIQRFNNEGV